MQEFQEGRTSISEVSEVIRVNHREIAEEMGISVGVCHAILTRKLQMHHVSAKFIPHLLTDGQK